MIKTIKVSDKGQIAIPQPMRENLGIERGDELILIQLDGKLLVEKSKKTETMIIDDFKDILKFSEKSLKDIWNNKDDDVWNQYIK
jgi:AbrB family looped-hinge helix DNA binding protein